MSKIQEKPNLPMERPAPKNRTSAGAGAPFAQAAQAAQTAQARQQCAKTVRQAHIALLAVLDERQPAPSQGRTYLAPDGEPDPWPRCGAGALHGQPFGEPDPCGQAQDGVAGRGGAAQIGQMHAAALEQELDCAALARLLPGGLNDGIFDVVLPTGERLGVVVNGQSASLSYLLSPSPEQFGSRLRRQRMELEERMERLTHRNVRITVL